MVSDPLFGPILGVKSADGETRLRLIPMTDQDALQLVPTSVRDSGHETVWTDALLRLSRLAEECPEVQSFEIAPVMVRDGGLLAGECTVRVRSV